MGNNGRQDDPIAWRLRECPIIERVEVVDLQFLRQQSRPVWWKCVQKILLLSISDVVILTVLYVASLEAVLVSRREARLKGV
jgi:hypothetical protein